jgi:hypothetical protein
LIAPTVELVARDNLHPAISDLLIEAAREVMAAPIYCNVPGCFQRRWNTNSGQ